MKKLLTVLITILYCFSSLAKMIRYAVKRAVENAEYSFCTYKNYRSKTYRSLPDTPVFLKKAAVS